jgi:hypothetical protein
VTVFSDGIQPFVQRNGDSKQAVGACDHTSARTIRKRSLPDPCQQTANVDFATPKGALQHDAEMDITQEFAGTLTQYPRSRESATRGRICMS